MKIDAHMENALHSWLVADLVPPGPANENFVLFGPPSSPSKALREGRLTNDWLLRRVIRQPDLLWDPEWQFIWRNNLVFQRCLTWRYLEQRWPWPT
jgi:hypothetical protein